MAPLYAARASDLNGMSYAVDYLHPPTLNHDLADLLLLGRLLDTVFSPASMSRRMASDRDGRSG